MRKRGFTVALIGPDGSGKTTVARALDGALSLPVKYLYMGVNWEASNHLLPTTRLVQAIRSSRGHPADTGGPPDIPSAPPPGRPWGQKALRAGWSALALANRLAEEWYRQLIAWRFVRRGFVVVFDRHFFSDYHAYDVAGRGHQSLTRRAHGFLLARVYPKPTILIMLDAPAGVLYARKGEGTVESLERRRRDYLELADVARHFVVVDASRPLPEVVSEVVGEIESLAASGRGSGAGR
jgi:thymidylate kinase